LAKKNIGFLIIIVLIVIGLFFFGDKLGIQSVISPTANFITQYVGKPETVHDNSFIWMDNHPYPLDFNPTAIIGDYKIAVSSAGRGVKYGEPYCQANICGGTATAIDNDGCQHWEGTASTTVTYNLPDCSVAYCKCYYDHSATVGGDIISCSASSSGNAKDAWCVYSGNTVKLQGCLGCGTGTCRGSINAGVTYKVNCGGLTKDLLYESTSQCWSKADIYYKDALIKTLDWDNRRQSTHLNKGQITTHQEERLHIDLQTGSQYLAGSCYTIINDYIFTLKPEDFELNITAMQEQVFEGQLVAVNVSIKNNYGSPILGKLTVDFEVPTTIGSAKKTEEKMLTIPIGQSDHLFTIPTTQVTDKIYATPKVDFLMKGSDFQGTNYLCYGQTIMKDRALSSCEFVQIGEIKEKTFTVNIIPKPLYIKKPTTGCPIGYSENTGDKSLCLRDDIKSLSCFQLGCPVIAGNEYKCTSSGFCAETVFIQKNCTLDSDCPSDTKCDVGSGLCIKTEIFDRILQCDTASDCANPCIGKTAVCSLNKCEYSGVCIPTTIDCRVVGCPETYECSTSNNQYVCSKETVVKQKCGELGCPEGTTCNIDTGVCLMVTEITKEVIKEVQIPAEKGFDLSEIPIALKIIVGLIIGFIILKLFNWI